MPRGDVELPQRGDERRAILESVVLPVSRRRARQEPDRFEPSQFSLRSGRVDLDGMGGLRDEARARALREKIAQKFPPRAAAHERKK